MFKSIYLFETFSWLKRPVFYLFLIAFFLLPFILFIGSGGYFDADSTDENTVSLFINSPFQIYNFLQQTGELLFFLLPAVMGTSIYKDFRSNIFPLIYSYPVSKGVYLGAKFLSAFTLVFLISLMPVFAFLAGEAILGSESKLITIHSLNGYFYSFGYILFPNLWLFGTMVFSIVALSRNVYAGFILVLFLFIFQSIIENIFPNSFNLTALFDPFGQHASMQPSRFWTVSEKNTLPLVASNVLIYNRMLWILIAIIAASFTYNRFSLSHFGYKLFSIRKTYHKNPKLSYHSQHRGELIVQVEDGFKNRLLQLLILIRHQITYILTSWMFILFCGLAIILLIFMLNKVLQTNEVIMLPLTRLILQIPTFFYTQIIVFATFIFSGMIVLKAKDAEMEPLIFSSSLPTWVWIGSKVCSLVIIQTFLLVFLMVTGIIIQYQNGYFNYEIHQYLKTLFLFQAPVLAVWSLLSVSVYSTFRNLYSGMFLLMLVWLAQFGYGELGIETRILQFNTFEVQNYSDINGYGHGMAGRLGLQIYWLLWGVLVLFISALIFPRVQISTFSERYGLAFKGSSIIKSTTFGILIFLLISFIYFIRNEESKSLDIDQNLSVIDQFKEKFIGLKELPQPRITSVSMEMDIFPAVNGFLVSGEYILVNKSEVSIDTLLIKTSIDEITTYQIGAANQIIDSFPEFNFTIHKLLKPLIPGDSICINFIIKNQLNTLFQKNSGVLGNGTFLTHDILPRIGYFLNTDKPSPFEINIQENHYQSWDSDLVHFSATISTSSKQTAFTNGRLVDEWKMDDRNYSKYQTTQPVKFNFYFNSGQYQMYRDHAYGIPVTIYHHPDHLQNLVAIAGGARSAVEFNSKLFGKSQLEEIRIIEYPLSEGCFSTLKSNSILMSETLFGVNTDSFDKINLPFYVAAHEMTHHWFGNEVIPGDVQGAVFLTESITEYLTLQILKGKFGKEAAQKFLKVQHDRYFKGRADEIGEETPLILVESDQDYIAYGKGAIALNALARTIGEDNFHNFLSDFFNTYSSIKRYPTTIEFLELLKKFASIDKQYLVDELLTKSVVYENQIISAELKQNMDKSWICKIEYNIQAFEKGRPVVHSALKDVELGVYDEKERLIALIPVSTKDKQRSFLLTSDSKPYQLILDPGFHTLDKDRSNNSILLE